MVRTRESSPAALSVPSLKKAKPRCSSCFFGALACADTNSHTNGREKNIVEGVRTHDRGALLGFCCHQARPRKVTPAHTRTRAHTPDARALRRCPVQTGASTRTRHYGDMQTVAYGVGHVPIMAYRRIPMQGLHPTMYPLEWTSGDLPSEMHVCPICCRCYIAKSEVGSRVSRVQRCVNQAARPRKKKASPSIT